jgi:homoserine dehydrogenase
MQTINMCLLGFGNVGQAFASLLLEKRSSIQDQYALNMQVVAIKTGRHGALIDPDGLDLAQVLEISNKGELLTPTTQETAQGDLASFLEASGATIMAENTPVSYADGQPALDHIRIALGLGMHVVTANKGPVVHAHEELIQLAATNNCRFLFESTVMDGAPIFSLWRDALPAADLSSFRGILNSTTNLILTRMETGESFDDAVMYAQSIGIAETDPSGDIDGWDAAIKVAALVNVLMGAKLSPQEVQRQGIRDIQMEQVQLALQDGQRWKLICESRLEGESVAASVKPMLIDQSDPLFSVMGTSSAVTFHSDVLGALTVTEEDPGPHTTAYGLLADTLNILRPSHQ